MRHGRGLVHNGVLIALAQLLDPPRQVKIHFHRVDDLVAVDVGGPANPSSKALVKMPFCSAPSSADSCRLSEEANVMRPGPALLNSLMRPTVSKRAVLLKPSRPPAD